MRALVVFTIVFALIDSPARATTTWSGGDLPPAPGLAHNHDAEPGAAVASDGTLWATSTIAGTDPRGFGQDIWRSSDGGISWSWIAAPFNAVDRRIGGNDGDIAVAPERNANGYYTVYAASLWRDGVLAYSLNISLAISRDGGASWIVHPLAAEVPGDDRPWLAADGPCRVYLVYHAGPTVANVVNVYDLCDPAVTVAGVTVAPVASTRYPALAVPFVTGQPGTYVTAGFGKPAIDISPRSPYRHRVYVPMVDCPNLTPSQEIVRAEAQDVNCPRGTKARVFMATGDDGGTKWTLTPLADTTNSAVPSWPATVATDGEGHAHVAWHDDHDSWVQSSTDGGTTWTSPVRVPAPGTAVYPTIAAAGATVSVAWYGADRHGNANDPGAMGVPNTAGSARWSLWWSRSNDGGASFEPAVQVDPLIHAGVLCTRGSACSIPDSRTLLEDFAMVVSPVTSRATIIYTSDQPGGHRETDVTRWATSTSLTGARRRAASAPRCRARTRHTRIDASRDAAGDRGTADRRCRRVRT